MSEVPPIDESLAPNTTHLEALGQRVEDLDALGEKLRIGEHAGFLEGDLRREVPQVLGRMLHTLADALHHVHALHSAAAPAGPPPVVETEAAPGTSPAGV